MPNAESKTNGSQFITYSIFDCFEDVAHFSTTRFGGVSLGNYASFNISPFTGDDPQHQKKNLTLLSELAGFKQNRLVVPFQNHGDKILEIDQSYFELKPNEQEQMLYGVDALITNASNICIGVTTADCVPLLFYDPIQKVIAAVHAGWRGTCAKIASKTILYFQTHYLSNPADIRVVFGPSISPSVYQVGEELLEEFSKQGFPTHGIFEHREGVLHLDLWKANLWQLTRLGVLESNIEVSGICAFSEHERFFSARRLGIKSGRILTAIMLK